MLLFICEWKKEKKVFGSKRQLDEFGINLFAVTTHLHVIIEPADTAQDAGLLVKQESAFGTIFNVFHQFHQNLTCVVLQCTVFIDHLTAPVYGYKKYLFSSINCIFNII